MKDQETKTKFVELGAKGWSFDRKIAQDLKIDEGTIRKRLKRKSEKMKRPSSSISKRAATKHRDLS